MAKDLSIDNFTDLMVDFNHPYPMASLASIIARFLDNFNLVADEVWSRSARTVASSWVNELEGEAHVLHRIVPAASLKSFRQDMKVLCEMSPEARAIILPIVLSGVRP